MVGVGHSSWPARRVAGMEQVRTVLLDHGRLARKHVEELVLFFVPMPVGRPRPRLQRMDVGAELGQPALVGQVQPLGWAVILRIFLVRVDHRCLAFPDDHLDPPKVCAVPCLGAPERFLPRKPRTSRYSNFRKSKYPKFAEPLIDELWRTPYRRSSRRGPIAAVRSAQEPPCGVARS